MFLKITGLTFLALGFCSGFTGEAETPRLAFVPDPARPWSATVALEGLPPEILSRLAALEPDRSQWKRVFPVFYGRPEPGKPAMLGSWQVQRGAVIFSPRFPFEPGESYRAEADLDALCELVSLPKGWKPRIGIDFAIPSEPAVEASNEVTGIFPSGDTLPANLLRFYIHFSEPIAPGGNYRQIRLLDARGGEVADAFLETPELWDPEGKRLTLFFHPGRIKRGLALHDHLGLALEPGSRFSLVVAEEIRDRSGRPLRREYRKTFSVSDEDRTSPDPSAWLLDAPAGGQSRPLALRFDEPLDRALLFRLIRVFGKDDVEIEGSVKVTEEETLWSFFPVEPWEPGDYEVVISTALEDRAGNRLQQLFDAVSGAEPKISGEVLVLPFAVPVPGKSKDR